MKSNCSRQMQRLNEAGVGSNQNENLLLALRDDDFEITVLE